MLSVPPPNSGSAGAVAIEIAVVCVMCRPVSASRSAVFGSSRIA